MTPIQLAVSKMLEFLNIRSTFSDYTTEKGYSLFKIGEKSIIVLENNFSDEDNIKEIIKPNKKNLIVSSRIASDSIEGIFGKMCSTPWTHFIIISRINWKFRKWNGS